MASTCTVASGLTAAKDIRRGLLKACLNDYSGCLQSCGILYKQSCAPLIPESVLLGLHRD